MKKTAVLLCSILLWSTIGQASDYGFSIKNAAVNPAGRVYVLNADVDYRFSSRAAEALSHGVPLTFVVKVRVNRQRRFFWNKTVFSKDMVYRLSYHAFRKRYRVYDESAGAHQYFASLKPALESMGKIRDLPVLSVEELKTDAKYDARLKASLDIESLPLPLRSIAYLIPQWHISSGWYTWSLEQSNRP